MGGFVLLYYLLFFSVVQEKIRVWPMFWSLNFLKRKSFFFKFLVSRTGLAFSGDSAASCGIIIKLNVSRFTCFTTNHKNVDKENK